jgi:hypothetical protein
MELHYTITFIGKAQLYRNKEAVIKIISTEINSFEILEIPQ